MRYAPMLLVKIPKPFDSDEHSFEIKYDGYRALVYVERSGTRVMSRHGTDLTPAFPEFSNLWPRLRRSTVLDCELVVLDTMGRADFDALQRRYFARQAQIQATLVAFDVLHHGRTLIDRPLRVRAAALERLVPPADPVLMRSIPIVGRGLALHACLETAMIEGMVAKRLDSTYEQRRSRAWLKVYTDAGRATLRARMAHVRRQRR